MSGDEQSLKDKVTASPHIVYAIGSTQIGGAERHLLRVCENLFQKGWRITLYTLSEPGPLYDSFCQCTHEIKTISPPRVKGPLGKVFKAVAFIKQFILFFLFVRKEKPRIVHFFLPTAYLVFAPAALLAGGAIRIMSRRSLNVYMENRPFIQRIERFLHQRMDLVLGNSEAVCQQLCAEEGLQESQVELIYNGIEPDMNQSASSLRSELGISEDALVLTIVANLYTYKGHQDLFKALGKISTDMPKGWKLLVVGRDEENNKMQLTGLAADLGIAENIIFLGQRSDVEAIYNQSDLALLVSHQEGFSNSILEAMRASLPLVVTDTGGNAEAVHHNETGLVVPIKDPESLSQAIVQLSVNPEKRRLFGQRGRQRVQKEFNIDTCCERYEHTYKRLLAKR